MARSQLSRHPCRSTHSAKPPLGLPKGRQIKIKIKSKIKIKIKIKIKSKSKSKSKSNCTVSVRLSPLDARD